MVQKMLCPRHVLTPLLSSAILVALTACGPHYTSGKELIERFPTPIYSMDGEPLNGGTLGKPTCESAQSAWLERQDLDHDGTLDLDEVLSAARARFTAMDPDGDGYITSDELLTYRQHVMGGEFEQSPPKPETGSTEDDGGHRPRLTKVSNRPQGSQPDPVLAADSNLDFKVTLEEFLALQRENFIHLDRDHDHTVSTEELTALCRVRERAAQPNQR